MLCLLSLLNTQCQLLQGPSAFCSLTWVLHPFKPALRFTFHIKHNHTVKQLDHAAPHWLQSERAQNFQLDYHQQTAHSCHVCRFIDGTLLAVLMVCLYAGVLWRTNGRAKPFTSDMAVKICMLTPCTPAPLCTRMNL